MTASACGVQVRDYGHLLQDDPDYRHKAARVALLTRDITEILTAESERLQIILTDLPPPDDAAKQIAFHSPCTLQHGQKLKGGVETHLAALGFAIQVANTEAHLCCGSAGTYSVLNPDISYTLRDRKLGHLGQTFKAGAPDQIVSANIGCITHLQSGTATPVRHWIEVLDEALV
mgnify:CR=1 FL=1